MKDIRSLYLAARNTGSDEDINAYTESINELVMNRPYDYLPHLEYIISSSTGVGTFLPFIEKYGFPIAAYDDTMACFEKCCVQGAHPPLQDAPEFLLGHVGEGHIVAHDEGQPPVVVLHV